MKKICIFLLLCLTLLTVPSPVKGDNEIYMHNTRLGIVNGLKKDSGKKIIYQFRKMPYAKPPLKDLRFEIPQEYGTWGNVLNATAYGPNCMQFLGQDIRLLPNLQVSEDCLHLNIIAPNDLNNSSRRPVFIWIHGGGFTNGQGMSVDGSVFAATGDVILVTINYRLNIFGFVNVGIAHPRNLGLWDQKFAIKWIKQNIADFGGDPNTITLFGESAGGVSVGLQSIIPTNIGLFQRAIAQSGSFFSLRDIGTDSENLTREIGRVLNCSNCQDGDLLCLECFRRFSARDLLLGYGKGVSNLRKGFSLKAPIGPIVDQDLIPNDIFTMLSDSSSETSKMFNSIDFIAGSNDGEAGLFYFNLIGQQRAFHFDLKQGIPTRVLCNNIVPYVTKEVLKGCDNISHAICDKYSNDVRANSLSDETVLAVNFFSDLEMSSLAARCLNFHNSASKNRYQYLFTHKPTWGVIADRPSWLLGANHVDELPFLFGLRRWYPGNVSITPTEDALSSKIMSYWYNFGRTGDPNPKGTSEWPKFTKTSASAFIIGEYRNATVDNFQDRMQFWNEEIPKLLAQCSSQQGNVSVVHSGFG
ncbi:acetylcholinesterase-like isoform X1 [Mytilus trossulus]|uniref:acetylcholinesterase-like isoform X1 n=2 Tax=Mytilus trossulus TaxID=6551 RepID=UPI003003E7C3